ncbi:MAG: FAD/NAD(P)-binding protein [Acidobacteriota bacterium]
MSELDVDVAIVGGGCAGALAALHLVRDSRWPRRVSLIERRAQIAEGIAYSTQDLEHRLNVRAAGMTAFPDRPEDFATWAAAHGRYAGHDFVPRRQYAEYLRQRLQEASDGRVATIHDEAVTATRLPTGGWLLQLASGRRITASRVVLAVGFPPTSRSAPFDAVRVDDPRLVTDPFNLERLSAVAGPEPIAIVGTGLTAIDSILTLKRVGQTGPIHAISRRGLWPQAHAASEAWSLRFDPANPPSSTVELLRAVRRDASAAESEHGNWRSVIDALRPWTQSIWQSLSMTERRRFLRHLRPYWDVHRHRMAPDVWERIAGWVGSGAVVLHRARVRSVGVDTQHLHLVLQRSEDRDMSSLPVAGLVLAMGVDEDYRKHPSPLIQSLIRDGNAVPHPLSLGLRTAPDGELLDQDGRVVDGLMTIGTVRKGDLWESTAVPELRVQAARLAEHLTRQKGAGPESE